VTDELKHGARRLVKRLAYGVAIGLLLFFVARIAAKIVGSEMVGWFIVIFGPIIIGYFILWPQLNRLATGLLDFLFYSSKPLEDAPVMSRPRGLRQQERFEEALVEYGKIVGNTTYCLTLTSRPCGHRLAGDEAGFQGHCLKAGSEHSTHVVDTGANHARRFVRFFYPSRHCRRFG